MYLGDLGHLMTVRGEHNGPIELAISNYDAKQVIAVRESEIFIEAGVVLPRINQLFYNVNLNDLIIGNLNKELPFFIKNFLINVGVIFDMNNDLDDSIIILPEGFMSDQLISVGDSILIREYKWRIY